MDNSSLEQEIETIYQDYRKTAIQIKKNAAKQSLPLSIIGLIILFGGLSSIFWAGYKAMANFMCWGTVIGSIFSLIALFVQMKSGNDRAAMIAKPGFLTYYKRFNTWGSPKTLINSSYYETFKSTIGK